ncbi:MAG: hypothetical protein K2O42_05050 [Oscillospiraceae bacterium]|nr:hypothetical protein [Oscillospiraceae bacterium]
MPDCTALPWRIIFCTQLKNIKELSALRRRYFLKCRTRCGLQRPSRN